MGRYEKMFDDLKGRGESAFVPFVTIGDPDLKTSARIVRALVEGGADALDVGDGGGGRHGGVSLEG